VFASLRRSVFAFGCSSFFSPAARLSRFAFTNAEVDLRAASGFSIIGKAEPVPRATNLIVSALGAGFAGRPSAQIDRSRRSETGERQQTGGTPETKISGLAVLILERKALTLLRLFDKSSRVG